MEYTICVVELHGLHVFLDPETVLLISGVAGFSDARRASSNNGRSWQKLQTLNKSQLFIKFTFIFLNNLNFFVGRKINFF